MKREDSCEVVCGCGEVHEDIIGAVRVAIPRGEELSELSDFFKIFGDPTRLSILFALTEGAMCGCDLVASLGMTKAVISYQLKVLKRHNLVVSYKEGRKIFYSLSDEHVRDIIEIAIQHINE